MFMHPCECECIFLILIMSIHDASEGVLLLMRICVFVLGLNNN